MYLTNNPSIQEVLFFPQMRPEVHAVKVELTENEKAIFDIVESTGTMDLNTLKAKAGLSGKQWDVSIKSLTKQGLLKVKKIGDDLTIELV
jgi:lysyl-tRNA synthetase class 2